MPSNRSNRAGVEQPVPPIPISRSSRRGASSVQFGFSPAETSFEREGFLNDPAAAAASDIARELIAQSQARTFDTEPYSRSVVWDETESHDQAPAERPVEAAPQRSLDEVMDITPAPSPWETSPSVREALEQYRARQVRASGRTLNPYTLSGLDPRSMGTEATTQPSYYSGDTDSNGYSQNNTQQSSQLSGNVEVNSQMITVAQVFGHRASYPTIEGHPLIVGTHLAGVEIELENIRNSAPAFQYWEAKTDGSLRNGGMEFVCSAPWGGHDLYEAAIEIDAYLFGNNPDESWRCSTHVHVDVRDMNAAQLKRMILAYIFYERVLFKCSGWHRYKNNFCVALGFAQEQLAILSRNWNLPDDEFMRNICGSWDKYSSINLLPMQNFGSVEFRISEAKWRKGKLIRLTNRFLSLKELATSFEGTDTAFVEHLMGTPLHLALRKSLPKILPPDFQQDLEIGYKLAHDVISMAPLRRRLTYIHVVRSEEDDTSRRMPINLNDHYWSHLRSHLDSRSQGTWTLEQRKPSVITFEWLYQLSLKCREWSITFDLDWFEPTMLIRQQRELLRSYIANQGSEAPIRRRGGHTYSSEPVFDGEDDDDDEGHLDDDDI